jgi:hypothetical protein
MRCGGRAQIDSELRGLIRRMSEENPLWDAPRIRENCLESGLKIAESSVAKYMVKRRATTQPAMVSIGARVRRIRSPYRWRDLHP